MLGGLLRENAKIEQLLCKSVPRASYAQEFRPDRAQESASDHVAAMASSAVRPNPFLISTPHMIWSTSAMYDIEKRKKQTHSNNRFDQFTKNQNQWLVYNVVDWLSKFAVRLPYNHIHLVNTLTFGGVCSWYGSTRVHHTG